MIGEKVKILSFDNGYLLSGEVISNIYSSTSTQYSRAPRSGSSYSNINSTECVVVKLDGGEVIRDVPICRIEGVISFDDFMERYADTFDEDMGW